MSVITFDDLFPVKGTGLDGADRLFGYDKDGVKNAAFTLLALKAFFGGGDWNSLANKPETFAPAGHTLGSHTGTEGLDAAPDGTMILKVAGKWKAVVPGFANASDIPNVPAWVLAITETMIENWNEAFSFGSHASAGYLTSETDPVFQASVAAAISETDIANWNAAFGRGDHADAGYLTSETDPVFQASPAGGITLGHISVWNSKTLEYAGFADGDTPIIVNGEAKVSGLKANLSENPFSPETEEEDYYNWTPAVESFVFPVPVKGVPGVEPEDFVTKEQLDANGGVNQETKFLSGGFWVYSGTGLVFDTVATQAQFPGSNDIVTIPGTRIDLSTFPALDNATQQQFVRPKWNRAGVVTPLFGPASSYAQVPSVDDPVNEIAGDPLLLSAGATSIPPVQIQTGIIFAEGAPTEAAMGHSGAGTSNFASTVNPISGGISAELTNVQANTTTNATPPAPVTLSDFTAIAIKIRLKAPMAPGHNLGLFFRKAGAIVTKTRMLPIDRNNLGVQVLGIPLSQFESSEATVDQLVLRWYRSNGDVTHPGYFFDDWILQGGIQPPPPDTDGVRSVTGDGVGGTAKDVVLTFPTPAQIGAYTKTEADAKFETIETVQQLASDLTDLENQVQDIEEDVEDHEDRITELENAGPGGGADSNAVHYNAADGKNATEQQQARTNIGLPNGEVTELNASFGGMITRDSNCIVFTEDTALRYYSTMLAGTDNEIVLFINRRTNAIVLNHNSGTGGVENRFSMPNGLGYRIEAGKYSFLRYDASIQRWTLLFDSSYLRKDVIDVKSGDLSIQSIAGVMRFLFKTEGSTVGSTAALNIQNPAGTASYLIMRNNGSFEFDNAVGGSGGLIGNLLSFRNLGIEFAGFGRGMVSSGQPSFYCNNTVRLVGGAMMDTRSTASDRAMRRDEQALLYPITVTTAGTIHDLAETAGNFNYYLTACTEITGMSGGENGKSRTIQNHSAANMIARHQNTGSIAANRYDILGGADLTIPPGGSVEWSYVAGLINRWRLKSKNF
jgi:hypothetical protein